MAIMKCDECGRVDDCYDIPDEQFCGCGGTMATYFPPATDEELAAADSLDYWLDASEDDDG